MSGTFHALPIKRSWTGPNGGELRIVVIDAAYDTMHHPVTQDLLTKIMAMKIDGYQKEYPYGVLPVDIGDVIGTHLLICEDVKGKLEPLAGLKAISGKRCEIHRVEFPALHLACPHELPRHHEAVQNEIGEIKARNEKYAYTGSWTMAPIVRQDKELSKLCKYISISFFVHYFREYGISNVFAGATLRFKVEQWKAFLGFKPMTFHGEVLPDFNCTPFFGEPVRLMLLREYTEEGLEFAKSYRTLWDKRITLDRHVESRTVAA